MKIYYNGELIHVDSSKDIIEHFGIKGYAQRVMKEVDKIAKDGKHTHVTLEVPEISPNARHVYKKLGYKEGKTTQAEGWGTLTDMRKEIR